MPIQTIETKRLYRQIADQVTRLIDDGDIRAGERLPPERELAEKLGVSRPSVREALIALEVEGLVEVRGGLGVFVQERRAPRREAANGAAPGPFDLLRARWIIESEAAYLAAVHAQPQQLQRMHDALHEMEGAHTHSPASTAADERFHLAIAEASGNAALLMVVQLLWELRTGALYTQLESHFSGETVWSEALVEHRALLDAIASRDPPGARKAMRRHMKNAEIRFASGWKPPVAETRP
ncbi:MAG TPA: FadR/GntR family transcriptional regulator [Albitalea sp.]|uniref:FadR/GntR family transcriptional regulator n=1 Tax=Piscinibacter sp. TaxID=1903157 RepID=UPI002ED469CA